MNTTYLERLIDRYCEAWSDPDTSARAAALADVWTGSATYSDPSAHVVGASGLLAHIGQVRASHPNARVARTTRVDAYGVNARFGWQMILADGARLPEGLDIVRMSADGARIESVIGFFGSLKPR